MGIDGNGNGDGDDDDPGGGGPDAALLMTNIKDYFKSHREAQSAEGVSGEAARKTPAAMEDLSAQKLSRSKKTLAKSEPLARAPGTRKVPVILDDTDDEGRSSPPKRAKTGAAKAPSPAKAMSLGKTSPSPTKAMSLGKTSPSPTKAASPKKMSSSPAKTASPKKTQPEHSTPSKTLPTRAEEPEDKATPKQFSYRDYLQRKAAGPSAPGSKPIPTGAPNCLEGLTFVFTGQLESLSREDAQDLVRRHGGRVTTAPSGKTSFVVVGSEAGQSKLDKIAALGIKTLDEDGLLDMIAKTGGSQESRAGDSRSSPAAKQSSQQFREEDIIKATIAKPAHPAKLPRVTVVHPEIGRYELWTDKYAPQVETELVGNHSNYERIVSWLGNWTPGASGERAILISGPPGIGKTTAAHLACKQAGVEIVEMNASDTRSKSSLHEHVRDMIDNRSLAGFEFFSKENQGGRAGHQFKKQVLIMDEVDGMSAGDRGGMAELIQLIKKTKIPIICICNDRSSPKVRSLANHCLDLRFRRPDARMITPRIMAIAQQEGLQLGLNTVEELVASTQGDIRQILTLLSTYRLTSQKMDFDQSKSLGGASKKDVDHGPFDAVPNLLGSHYDRMSMAERIDQYFVDSSLVPLMVQENYLRAKAVAPRTLNGKTGGHSYIELCSAAADSISDADWVDSLIRGSNQEWSLAPLHAVMSSVRPAYYCHGAMGGRVEFATWLGQNSKQTKNMRLLGEITKHVYLHTGVGKAEMRMSYAPVLAEALLQPLIKDGADGIDRTIGVMDAYTLAREDVDALLDLVLDPKISSAAYAKIPTATKSAFTRKYNAGVHRLPYAVGGVTVAKRISEDVAVPTAAEDDEEAALMMADNGAGEEDDSDTDITKDKMIRARSSKAAGGAASGSVRGRGRGRGRGKQ